MRPKQQPQVGSRRRTAQTLERPGALQSNVLRILHPFPSFLVAALTVALALFADPHAGRLVYVQLGLGMLLFQFAIGLTNDIVDIDSDRQEKPWKPLARGAIPRERAVLLAAGCAGAGLLLTVSLPLVAWLLGVAGLFCGLAYDAYFKRTPLSWLPYSLAFPLIPAWVFASLKAWDALLWWVFPLGAVLGLALHLANQVPDIEGDRRAGVVGSAQRLGGRRSRAASIALFGIVASVVVVVLLFESPGHALIAAIDAAIVLMLAPRAQVFFGRDGLFGLLAASSAVLAIIFLSAV
jgi:4-hydroxybenzoate polyprenyltransferase